MSPRMHKFSASVLPPMVHAYLFERYWNRETNEFEAIESERDRMLYLFATGQPLKICTSSTLALYCELYMFGAEKMWPALTDAVGQVLRHGINKELSEYVVAQDDDDIEGIIEKWKLFIMEVFGYAQDIDDPEVYRWAVMHLYKWPWKLPPPQNEERAPLNRLRTLPPAVHAYLFERYWNRETNEFEAIESERDRMLYLFATGQPLEICTSFTLALYCKLYMFGTEKMWPALTDAVGEALVQGVETKLSEYSTLYDHEEGSISKVFEAAQKMRDPVAYGWAAIHLHDWPQNLLPALTGAGEEEAAVAAAVAEDGSENGTEFDSDSE